MFETISSPGTATATDEGEKIITVLPIVVVKSAKPYTFCVISLTLAVGSTSESLARALSANTARKSDDLILIMIKI